VLHRIDGIELRGECDEKRNSISLGEGRTLREEEREAKRFCNGKIGGEEEVF
jgi:hypothetical protein